MTTDMQSAARTFFSSSHFATAGASSAPSKFGHKIFAWYLAHDLPCVPLNPSTPSVTLHHKQHLTLPSPLQLPDPQNTSLSIVTPPAVTAKVLREAKEIGVRSVWLQPGTFGREEMGFAMREWPGRAVGGFEGGTVGGEGWCVLVDGEGCLRAVEKEKEGKL